MATVLPTDFQFGGVNQRTAESPALPTWIDSNPIKIVTAQRASDRSVTHVPDDVLNFIATHITGTIRELEGALNRVCAYAGLNRVALNLAMAETVLGDLMSGKEPRPVTAKAIMNATMVDMAIVPQATTPLKSSLYGLSFRYPPTSQLITAPANGAKIIILKRLFSFIVRYDFANSSLLLNRVS